MAAKVLYTAKVRTTGGREHGLSKSSDGHLDLRLTAPGKGEGTNPEQLFAAGWSACFEGALGVAALQRKLTLPAATAIDAEVDLLNEGPGNYLIRGRLNVSIPGVDRQTAQALVEAAHQICPYSKATRGNIEVELKVV
ncbi:MAG TPA: organic hydroperoxide resistance protein [Kiloniellales bacterium]|nr:organic hydroperoxide resistance protein [Kiloniellales bacterium]